MIVIVFIFLYLFLLVFFKRELVNFKLGSENIYSMENSLWDEWWNTGRPVPREMHRRYGLEELWPLINKALGDLFVKNDQILRSDIHDKLERWLKFLQIPKILPYISLFL